MILAEVTKRLSSPSDRTPVFPNRPDDDTGVWDIRFDQELFDKYRASDYNTFIGDDLDETDLDRLWGHFALSDGYYGWWEDKPHQIAYRLVLRLTRVENELRELKEKMK